MPVQDTKELVYGVVSPRKRGDTRDFVLTLKVEDAPDSKMFIPLDLTGTTGHRFKVMSALGVVIFDLGAGLVTPPGGSSVRATPSLNDVTNNYGDAPFLGELHFTDVSGRHVVVPEDTYFAVLIRPDVR